jgi:hypothetical protein
MYIFSGRNFSMTINLRTYRITMERKKILGEDLILFMSQKQGVNAIMGYWVL